MELVYTSEVGHVRRQERGQEDSTEFRKRFERQKLLKLSSEEGREEERARRNWSRNQWSKTHSRTENESLEWGVAARVTIAGGVNFGGGNDSTTENGNTTASSNATESSTTTASSNATASNNAAENNCNATKKKNAKEKEPSSPPVGEGKKRGKRDRWVES